MRGEDARLEFPVLNSLEVCISQPSRIVRTIKRTANFRGFAQFSRLLTKLESFTQKRLGVGSINLS